jgi:hypothetical protein
MNIDFLNHPSIYFIQESNGYNSTIYEWHNCFNHGLKWSEMKWNEMNCLVDWSWYLLFIFDRVCYLKCWIRFAGKQLNARFIQMTSWIRAIDEICICVYVCAYVYLCVYIYESVNLSVLISQIERFSMAGIAFNFFITTEICTQLLKHWEFEGSQFIHHITSYHIPYHHRFWMSINWWDQLLNPSSKTLILAISVDHNQHSGQSTFSKVNKRYQNQSMRQFDWVRFNSFDHWNNYVIHEMWTCVYLIVE